MLSVQDIIAKVQTYQPNGDFELLKRAYLFSSKMHHGQTRQSGEPFLVHPIEVASIVADLKLDVPSVAAGLLHDTVEDTLTTLEEIEIHFGEEIAHLVDGVTKLSKIRFSSSEEREAENFRKMVIAMAKDIRVILIKLSDRTHNMRTLEHMASNKQEKIARETMEIYAPLANRLGIQWIKTELEDLSFRYMNPEAYRQIAEKVALKRCERQDYVDEVRRLIGSDLAANSIGCEVYGRPKHLWSIYRKMQVQHLEFEDIHDVVAFRVIVDSVAHCYAALGIVHSLWKPVPGRFKDYIALPKPNLYQSLHTTVIGPGAERIEIQMRTREMHQTAEQGIAAHWAYKEGKAAASSEGQKFQWLRQLMEWQKDLDDPAEFMDTVKIDLFADEVYVFTPKGDVRAFPKGATPVDFAYAVHTQVGDKCVGAKVNGRMVPIKHELRNGDTIEVLTNPNSHPNKDWLKFVKTSRAKAKIRHFVRTEQRERGREIGRELLERDFRKRGHSYVKMSKHGDLETMFRELRVKTLDELEIAVGYGKLTTEQILAHIDPPTPATRTEQAQGFIAGLFKRPRKESGGIVVDGLDDVLMRFGKCCAPVHGDPIVGFITRGKGVTIHAKVCRKVLDTDPQRRIDVRWSEKSENARTVAVKVISTDKTGLLAEVSQLFTAAGINIAQAHCIANDARHAVNTFHVSVKDAQQLKAVMKKIQGVNGVISVRRASGDRSS